MTTFVSGQRPTLSLLTVVASLGILLSLDVKMTLGQEQGMLDVVSSYCFARRLSFRATRSKRAWQLKTLMQEHEYRLAKLIKP